MSASSTSTPVSPGLHVGEYVIDEEIGAGGMGKVYRAVHPVIGKSVAIKVLSQKMASNPNTIRRFVLEARTVNEIRHPNLVDIFSFGQLTDGRYYYIMEYLEGRSLGEVLRERGRLRPEEIYPVFSDVLRALEATHAKAVVHRDLKPDNVFLVCNPGGDLVRAKLLDFGLAKLIEGGGQQAAPLTGVGMAVGTPHYMAPEQCMARPVDGRTDLYALGVMFYEALTGGKPCTGDTTVAIWEAQVRKAPRPPIELAPETVGLELNRMVLKLLAKDPNDRYQTAGDVLAALGAMSARISSSRRIALGVRRSPAQLGADVLQAIPSSLNSEQLVPLGATPSPVNVKNTDELRVVLDDVVEVELIEEPASNSHNPSQMSALNIQLGGPSSAKDIRGPVVPLRPLAPISASARSTRGGPQSARLPSVVAALPSSGAPRRLGVIVAAIVLAAMAAGTGGLIVWRLLGR